MQGFPGPPSPSPERFHLVHCLLRSARFRHLHPCLLLALAAVAPAHAQADTPVMEQITRCHALMHGSPRDALALANELLATPALPAVAEIGVVSCRGFAQQLLGQGDGSLKAAARLQVLLETEGLVTGIIYEDKETACYEEAVPFQEKPLSQDVTKPSAEVFGSLCKEFC